VQKIKILPDIVANKIAAGEVIERPASVVKELLENALDAGADSIIVAVEAGGRRLIRVSDNGSGMSHDDALLSLERHATSKIENISDIENIVTLGFRGEALPSIVSVSKTIIETRIKEEEFGTRIIIEGGILRKVSDIGRDAGTDVEVKNLFFNLPARRKFLKSESTELLNIKRILYDAAVSSPGISLTLLSDGREVFNFRKCAEKKHMLNQIFGETLSHRMVPFSCAVDGITVDGFLGTPDTASTSLDQFIIVNNRPVKSKSIQHAVLRGYGQTLVRGLSPAFVLYFAIDPRRVDVNIHPTKREIRIHRDYVMLEELSGAVSKTVQSMDSAVDIGESAGTPLESRYSKSPITIYNPPSDRWFRETPRSEYSFGQPALHLSQTELAFSVHGQDAPRNVPGEAGGITVEHLFEGPTFLQLNDTYIITTIKEGVIIVDQHIAHERILYEEILGHFKGKPAAAQQLLFPLTLDFSAADFDIFEPMIPLLNKIGFGIEEFGERSVKVDAFPADLTNIEEGKILYEFIEEMRVHGKITSGYIDKLAAAIACRSAIKAGKSLSQPEMQFLIDKLFATQSPFVCPHGRPTIVKLTLEHLNRSFGR